MSDDQYWHNKYVQATDRTEAVEEECDKLLHELAAEKEISRVLRQELARFKAALTSDGQENAE